MQSFTEYDSPIRNYVNDTFNSAALMLLGGVITLNINGDISLSANIDIRTPIYYRVYNIISTRDVDITLPKIDSEVATGFQCIISNKSATGRLQILDSSANTVTIINPNFAIHLYAIGTSWLTNYFIPDTFSDSGIISYTKSVPTLVKNTSMVANGKLTAKSTASTNINTTTPTIIPFSSDVALDDNYYSLAAGTVTHLIAGKYKFSAIIGVNLGGLAALSSTTMRLYVNGSPINTNTSVISSSNLLAIGADGNYKLDTTVNIAANNTSSIRIFQTGVVIGKVTLAPCTINIEYMGA